MPSSEKMNSIHCSILDGTYVPSLVLTACTTTHTEIRRPGPRQSCQHLWRHWLCGAGDRGESGVGGRSDRQQAARTAFAAIPPLLLLPVLRSDIEGRGIEDANTSKLCSSLFGRSLASRSYLAMTPGVLLYYV